MSFNWFKSNTFQTSTVRSIRKSQKYGHMVCPDSKVKSHCHLLVKVRNSQKLARGLSTIVFLLISFLKYITWLAVTLSFVCFFIFSWYVAKRRFWFPPRSCLSNWQAICFDQSSSSSSSVGGGIGKPASEPNNPFSASHWKRRNTFFFDLGRRSFIS